MGRHHLANRLPEVGVALRPSTVSTRPTTTTSILKEKNHSD